MIIPFGLLRPQKSGFIQQGLYTEAQLNDLINNQNYIPVSTASELDALRTTTFQAMGAGTPWFSTYTTGIDKKYVQIIPIDIVSISNWTPYATFTGTYDGNEVAIDNMTISAKSGGLTAVSSGCSYNNVIITNYSNSSSLLTSIGCLSGSTNATTTIDNCHVYGEITGKNLLGGIVGQVLGGTFTNSTATVNVFANELSAIAQSGGFIGASQIAFSATNCKAFGNVGSISTTSKGRYQGGFIGYSMTADTITSCEASGNCYLEIDTSLTDLRGGGFVGFTNAAAIISKCKASGDIIGNGGIGYSGLGGFCGVNISATVTDCYATGNASATGIGTLNTVGGFCGWNLSAIINSYSIGAAIGGALWIGGFSGRLSGTTTVCYWDTVASGNPTSADATGKTTTEMRQEATYIGWDFTPTTGVWDIVESVSEPTLQ